jgi:hypothetical protein
VQVTTADGRPDPRIATSWCREGVTHDHAACGSLWDATDPSDVEQAARWADDRAAARRAADADVPTRDEVMSLISQYAAARLIANTTVPTKNQREVAAIVAGHERDEREVARLWAEIAAALTRAGLTSGQTC